MTDKTKPKLKQNVSLYKNQYINESFCNENKTMMGSPFIQVKQVLDSMVPMVYFCRLLHGCVNEEF